MLIKSTRIGTSAGTHRLVTHLADADDNEAVTILQGNVANLEDAVADARRFNRVYCLRHFIVAPELDIDRHQLRTAIELLAGEFGFDPDGPFVVEHAKRRAVAGVAGRHFHIVVPEVDPASGRVLSNRQDYARHEKLARSLEVLFGHPVTGGAHDLAVLATMRRDGRDDLTDQLTGQLGVGPRPVEAFSFAQHQAAKRDGVDLTLVRENVRAAVAEVSTGDELRHRLAAHGLIVERGEKPGTWIVRRADTNAFLGAAHRLAGMRRAEFNTLIERTDNDRRIDPNTANPEHSADDPHGHPGATSRHADDPVTGQSDGDADGRRERELPRQHHELVADDRQRHRAEPEVAGGSSREARRTGHRPDVAADDGHGLIEAVARAAAALAALRHRDVGMPLDQRVNQHLAGIEAQARAQIAAADNLPAPSQSRLDAARLYERSSGQRHDEVLRQYRAVEAILAEPKPPSSMLDRMLGRKPAETFDRAALERQSAGLRAEIITAERQALSATGAVARAERELAAANAAHQREAKEMTRRAEGILAETARARQMARAFPHLIWSGPTFTVWAGRKFERARRRQELRNPWARNLWGLPIDPGY